MSTVFDDILKAMKKGEKPDMEKIVKDTKDNKGSVKASGLKKIEEGFAYVDFSAKDKE